MELVLEIGDKEVYRMHPDNDREASRIKDSWKAIMKLTGVFDYQIVQIIQSKINHANYQQQTGSDDGELWQEAKLYQRVV